MSSARISTMFGPFAGSADFAADVGRAPSSRATTHSPGGAIPGSTRNRTCASRGWGGRGWVMAATPERGGPRPAPAGPHGSGYSPRRTRPGQTGNARRSGRRPVAGEATGQAEDAAPVARVGPRRVGHRRDRPVSATPVEDLSGGLAPRVG